MIRAVIDTNVLVSGLLSARGNEAIILLAVSEGLIRPCLSDDIIAEYRLVLARPKFAFGRVLIESVLSTFHDRGDLVQPVCHSSCSPDPADTKFLHCAHAANAEFIVTGNKRDFPETPYGMTHVVSASELLGRIMLEK